MSHSSGRQTCGTLYLNILICYQEQSAGNAAREALSHRKAMNCDTFDSMGTTLKYTGCGRCIDRHEIKMAEEGVTYKFLLVAEASDEEGRLLPGVVWQFTPLAGSEGARQIRPLMILAVCGRTSEVLWQPPPPTPGRHPGRTPLNAQLPISLGHFLHLKMVHLHKLQKGPSRYGCQLYR